MEDLELEENLEEYEEDIEEIEELDEDLEEDLIESDTYLLLRDVLDQNIETQHLPNNEKFDLLNEDDPRNTIYQVSDDATLRLYDKSTKEYKEMSGKEYNEYLIDEYGTNLVEYKKGEPNFYDYVHEITNEDISNYLNEEVNGSFNGIGKLEKTSSSVERYGENGTLDEAIQLIADELECSSDQVKDYINDHNLVIHECNADEFELISSDIHNVFRHTGSIGIKKDLDVLRQSIYETCNSDSLILEKENDIQQVNGVNAAIQDSLRYNHQLKRNYDKL